MSRNIRIISLAFRFAALAAKFGLFVVLAIFLEPAEVGLFGLIAATVNLSLYFLGLDFYIHANREFRIADADERKRILSQSARLFLCTHAVFLPLYVILFWAGILPWSIFAFVIALSIVEHLSTELYRLLIVYGRPALASFGFFLRLGSWPVIASLAMWFVPELRSLEAVLTFWLFGGIVSLILPALFVIKLPRSFRMPPLDFAWIKSGLVIALPFLAGTLCLRAIQTIDRYIFEGLLGADVLGAYVFFVGLASVLPAMLQAGVYAFVLPVLISAVHDKDWAEYASKLRELARGIVLGVVVLSVGVCIGTWLLLQFLERPIYLENFNLIFWALAANIVFAASMYFHIPLHALRKDNALALSHIAGLIVFVIATVAISPLSPYLAVPAGVVIGNLAILFLKARAYRDVQLSSVSTSGAIAHD